MTFYDKITEMDWNIKKQSPFLYDNMYNDICNLSFLDSFVENINNEYFSVSCYETLENKIDFIISITESNLYTIIMSKGYPVFEGEKNSRHIIFLGKIMAVCSKYLDDNMEIDDIQYSDIEEVPQMYYYDYYKSVLHNKVFSIKKSTHKSSDILAFPCSDGGVWTFIRQDDGYFCVIKSGYQHFLQTVSYHLKKIIL